MPGRERVSAWALYVVMAYSALSIATLPFIDALWLGELPVFAIPQIPKIEPAEFVNRLVLIPVMRAAGLSKGSYSPDYMAVKPYGLILMYLVPALVILAYAVINREKLRTWASVLLVAAAAILLCLDYAFTIIFSGQPGITIY